ncbi:MAG TPA: hypothetical protein VG890_08385, partial [Puia sp.]|nr:hypothetical protein [Puia sp.]
MKLFSAFLFFLCCAGTVAGQAPPFLSTDHAQPLQELTVAGVSGTTLRVIDAAGKAYVQMPVRALNSFKAGGAPGKQAVVIYDGQGREMARFPFELDAETTVDDGGTFRDLFQLLHKGMLVYSEDGTESPIQWRGQSRHFLVPWVLDNYHTMKGMQYFNAYGRNLIDVMHSMQRPDGMIWSFIASNNDGYYFQTAYEKYGFFLRDQDAYFVRQPVENHVEYVYVCSIYKCWKASGDDGWMKDLLSSAAAALDYSMHDSLRWSSRFQLLKRALTIDSWDFQVDDEYTPKLGIGNPMLVVYGKTKFGVFYGDNTGYAEACNELADMYAYAGEVMQAAKYRERAKQISERLNRLAWNGRFYTHYIDEDSTVKRDLGVDMSQQLSQSNAYSINRGIGHEKSVAIIKSYQDLRAHLPIGSPGEWYSIYPPFQRGFEVHNAVWQYMNGGVGGHVAGELALGSFNNGYESYGADILRRVLDLGNKYGQGKRVWFAYTGSFPEPPVTRYTSLNLSGSLNHNFSSSLPGMPMGNQTYHEVPFQISDSSGKYNALAISSTGTYARTVAVPVKATAKSIWLLHTGMGTATDNIYGTITFKYADGSSLSRYLIKEKQLSNWVFPSMTNALAGVAWHGPNAGFASVGTYWAALANPAPDKLIDSLIFTSAANESIYIVFGLTLSDQLPYERPTPESFGGPDNWAAATNMQALMEGLAGVTDSATAFQIPVLSPRWIASHTDSVYVTARYAASGAYVSYRFLHLPAKHSIRIDAAGSGKRIAFHVELPVAAKAVKVNGHAVAFA